MTEPSYTVSVLRAVSTHLEPTVDLAVIGKVNKYGNQCEQAGALFQPVGLDHFGGCGTLGGAFLTKLFATYTA